MQDAFSLLSHEKDTPRVKDTVWATLSDAELRTLVCQMQRTITQMQGELEILRRGVTRDLCPFCVKPVSTAYGVTVLDAPLNKRAVAYLVAVQPRFAFDSVLCIKKILSDYVITDSMFRHDATTAQILDVLLQYKFPLSALLQLLDDNEVNRHGKVLAMLVAE